MGLGVSIPEQVVTNDDLAKRFTTSDEWIRQRTGIEERHYAAEGVSTSDLGAEAARAAARDAGCALSEIDCILFATLSPDHHFPGAGCYMQHKLGLGGVPVMDIRNQCTGFLFALATADAFVRAGSFKKILVVGAEVHSSALNFSDAGRDVAVLFGDGAGAAIVSESPSPDRGFLSFDLHADGSHARALHLDVWDISKKPYIPDGPIDDRHRYPRMDGRAVFKHAVTRLAETITRTLTSNGLGVEDIGQLIPHQANLRINEHVAKALGFKPEQVHNNIQRYGNTTAASIPICLREARDMQRFHAGDAVIIAAFGSGFTWGSCLLRW